MQKKHANSDCLEYCGRVSPSQTYPKIKITHLRRPMTLDMHVFMYKVARGMQPYLPLSQSQEISHLSSADVCLFNLVAYVCSLVMLNT